MNAALAVIAALCDCAITTRCGSTLGSHTPEHQAHTHGTRVRDSVRRTQPRMGLRNQHGQAHVTHHAGMPAYDAAASNAPDQAVKHAVAAGCSPRGGGAVPVLCTVHVLCTACSTGTSATSRSDAGTSARPSVNISTGASTSPRPTCGGDPWCLCLITVTCTRQLHMRTRPWHA